MKIEIEDKFAEKYNLTVRECLELLMIAIYKKKGVHGAAIARVLDLSEFEFHTLLANKGEVVNYGVEDLINDMKDFDS